MLVRMRPSSPAGCAANGRRGVPRRFASMMANRTGDCRLRYTTNQPSSRDLSLHRRCSEGRRGRTGRVRPPIPDTEQALGRVPQGRSTTKIRARPEVAESDVVETGSTACQRHGTAWANHTTCVREKHRSSGRAQRPWTYEAVDTGLRRTRAAVARRAAPRAVLAERGRIAERVVHARRRMDDVIELADKRRA